VTFENATFQTNHESENQRIQHVLAAKGAGLQDKLTKKATNECKE
jgi:hypothetical protein